MTPVINPMWFYLIQICDAIGFAAMFSLIAFLILGVITAVATADESRHLNKFLVTTIVGLVVSGLLVVLVPSKETLVAMKASEFVTPDNLEAAKTALLDMVSQISSMIK